MTQRGALWVAMLVSACFTVALWNKADSLLMGDLGWWLQCSSRFAHGELPYRDFIWQYPPLALYLFGGAFRLFGEALWVPQVLLVSLSAIIVVLLWDLLRSLLRPSILLAVLVATVATGATSRTFFSLFSLMSYSPALHVTTIGLLLTLWGCCRIEKSPQRATLALVAGSWISLLAKQEAWLAVPALFGLLLLRDAFQGGQHRMRILGAGVAGALVPAAVLIYVAQTSGWSNFLDSMRGYGLATITCPWWPTGVGIWGMLSALGLALVVIVAGASWAPAQSLRVLGRRNAALLFLAAAAGFLFHAGYLLRQLPGFLSDPAGKLWSSSTVIFAMSSVWRSSIWGALVALVWYAWKLWREKTLDRAQWDVVGWLMLLAAIAVRGLFGSTISATPEVPALAYPLVIPVAALLLWPVLRGLVTEKVAVVFIVALLLGYGGLRTVGAWQVMLSSEQYGRVQTPAGAVWTKTPTEHQAVVNFVLQRTQPRDVVMELPDGGGVAFLTHRRAVGFSTMFFMIPSTQEVLDRDRKLVMAQPPAVVIGKATELNYGTFWGIRGAGVCAFPELVWSPPQSNWKADYLLPAVEFIEENYSEETRFGDWAVLVPKERLASR